MRLIVNLTWMMALSFLSLSGCQPSSDKGLKTTDGKYRYTSLNRPDFSINLDEEFYLIGDEVGSIKDCSNSAFPFCKILNSTIIMIPEPQIFKKIEDGYFEGKNESLGLEYILKTESLEFHGNKIKGYKFYVADAEEILKGEVMPGKLKGLYYYTIDQGVLFFEHNFDVKTFDVDELERRSEINWSNSRCGMFSISGKC